MCTCAGINSDADSDSGEGLTADGEFDWENLEPCMYSSDTSRTIFKSVVPKKVERILELENSIYIVVTQTRMTLKCILLLGRCEKRW